MFDYGVSQGGVQYQNGIRYVQTRVRDAGSNIITNNLLMIEGDESDRIADRFRELAPELTCDKEAQRAFHAMTRSARSRGLVLA